VAVPHVSVGSSPCHNAVILFVCKFIICASVDELTKDIENLREAEKSSQETICHYEAEFKVFYCTHTCRRHLDERGMRSGRCGSTAG